MDIDLEKNQEERISSDEEFSDEELSESGSDVDAKLAEDEVFDAEFLKVYSALKQKDQKIYDKNVKFFEESDDDDRQSPATEEEPKRKKPRLTLLDHQLYLKQDDDIEQLHKGGDELTPGRSYYDQELDDIKSNIKKIAEKVDDDSDDDFLKVKRSKRTDSKIDNIIKRMEDDELNEVEHLKQIWSDPEKLSEEDRFLRDYILNKRYIAANDMEDNDEDDEKSFFSKNLADLSATDGDEQASTSCQKLRNVDHHSDERDFDKISRIPRNATKTIRDLDEKRKKKEKRLKKLEKKTKLKKSMKDIDCEDIVGDLQTKFHYEETDPNDYGLTAEELLMANDDELDIWVKLVERQGCDRNDVELKKKTLPSVYQEQPAEQDAQEEGLEDPETDQKDKKKKKKKKHHRRGQMQANVGVAPDRLLSYGLSKTKLKKSKLLS